MVLPPQRVASASFENVNAGKKATLTIPRDGRRIRKIFLQADENGGGGLAAVADKLALVIGTRTVREYTPAQFADIVDLNGTKAVGESVEASTLVQIPFCEEWRRTAAEEDILGLGTGNLNGDLQLQVFIKSGITDIVLNAWEEIDYPTDANGNPKGAGEILQFQSVTIPHSAAGIHRYQTMPRFEKLHRLHIFSDKVSHVKITAGNIVLHDMSLEVNNDQLKRYGFNPATGVYHVVFDVHQRLVEHIQMRGLASFIIELTGDAGVSDYDIVAEFREAI